MIYFLFYFKDIKLSVKSIAQMRFSNKNMPATFQILTEIIKFA